MLNPCTICNNKDKESYDINKNKLQEAGICFGLLGDNLQSATDIIALYKNHTINKTWLFKPIPAMQDALEPSDINVVLGVKNENLAGLTRSLDAATEGVNPTIVHLKDTGIQYLTVGIEAISGVNSIDTLLQL
ncbi:uncharacterized protein A4U43_C06F4140 [Asparagus officinalis]|uniref:Uncharacterized protein n=1 Tax=Asparagus officinalis TaxID=4686 RepID=A0A5P1EMS2_ASPOF|nr:uncharacterized protein A4U43_C06F4140 [Asparagus officinalis]